MGKRFEKINVRGGQVFIFIDRQGLNAQRPTKCFCNGAVTGWFKFLSSFNVFVSWDRTRLRKGTTAETQSLAAMGLASWTETTKKQKVGNE